MSSVFLTVRPGLRVWERKTTQVSFSAYRPGCTPLTWLVTVGVALTSWLSGVCQRVHREATLPSPSWATVRSTPGKREALGTEKLPPVLMSRILLPGRSAYSPPGTDLSSHLPVSLRIQVTGVGPVLLGFVTPVIPALARRAAMPDRVRGGSCGCRRAQGECRGDEHQIGGPGSRCAGTDVGSPRRADG